MKNNYYLIIGVAFLSYLTGLIFQGTMRTSRYRYFMREVLNSAKFENIILIVCIGLILATLIFVWAMGIVSNYY